MTIKSQKQNQSIINKRRKQLRKKYNKQYRNQPTQRQKNNNRTALLLFLSIYLIGTSINILHTETSLFNHPNQPTSTLPQIVLEANRPQELQHETPLLVKKATSTPQSATAPVSLQEYTKDEIKSIIIEVAQKNNFPYINYLLKLAYFESGFNYNAINNKNRNKTADKGIFQINDIHNLTDEQRFDPYFSTQWTINKINAGYQHLWMADKIAKKSNLIFYNN